MSESEFDDSDRDSLSSIEAYDTMEEVQTPEEIQQINNVRNAVREWKTREFNKTSEKTSEPKGLSMLRHYVSKSARLFYDLTNYLKTSKNDEQNMKDNLYRNIIAAIGIPGGLSFHVKTLLETLLQRDLLELPFTIEPSAINTYAKNGIQVQQEFPEEE